ncbi:MAG TPA: hypothetical protein VHG72_06590 [Polyangia bacterium]|nr:hypothetical protein [Polyangia bacterium]
MIGKRHLTAMLWLLAPLAAGCDDLNTPIYFDSPTPLLEVTGLDAMGNPGRAENGMTLRFRNPTKQERAALDTQATALGFKVPWIQRAHVHLELSYQVTNLDSTDGTFAIGLDGADEYTKYDENIVAMTLQQGNNNPPVYIPLIPVTPQLLAAGQTVSGLVREDDFNEAELDLDAIGRWMAPFNAVLINNSQVNPIGLSMVPPNVVIPALIEVDVNFSANQHMQCNYVVRVRDDDDQLLHDTTNTLFSPTPTLFQPPAMTD